MKLANSVLVKVESSEDFKKTKVYVSQAIRDIRKRFNSTFTLVADSKNRTIQIKCNHGPSLDVLEGLVKKTH